MSSLMLNSCTVRNNVLMKRYLISHIIIGLVPNETKIYRLPSSSSLVHCLHNHSTSFDERHCVAKVFPSWRDLNGRASLSCVVDEVVDIVF